MRASWQSFWTDDSPIEELLSNLSPSPFQRQFLQGLTPVDAPAIGLEVSKRGLRRRPHLAAWVLNGRVQRWTNLLQPLLRADGSFASGLQISDLLPFLQAQDLFRPEAWLELTQPPRRQAGQSFLLFRQTLKALPPAEFRHQLEDLHGQLTPTLQQRLPLPDVGWWSALDALPVEGIEQLGLDLDPQGSGWRFLFAVSNPQALLKAIDFPVALRAGLEAFPLALALESRHSVQDRYALEVFPRYRHEHTIVGYPGEVPADASQWPVWPVHEALLPARRLQQLMQASVHVPSVAYGANNLALRGGLSHQKVVVEAGVPVDHKAYLGVMVTGSKAATERRSALECAIEWLAGASDGWWGFALSPGVSDQWVPLACLTLLAPWRDDSRLRAAYAKQVDQLKSILGEPRPVGYSHRTPPDLDSSIWLRRCLLALQRPSTEALDQFLAEGWIDGHGVRTYCDSQAIADFIHRPAKELSGWCSLHDCVLANWAADPALPQAAQALQQLRNRLQQKQFGAYWWPLDGLVLSLMPRGSLPRGVIEACFNQSLPSAVAAVMPGAERERVLRFSRALMLLRHGTAGEQQEGHAELEALIDSPEAFRNLLVMQLPDPDRTDPTTQTAWTWNGPMEGALAPDPLGYLAAALVVSVQERSR